LEFRVDNSQNAGGALDCNLNGAQMNGATCTVPTLTPGVSGYRFDNVQTTTSTTGGPAPTVCGVPEVGKITPTGTTCQQYRDNAASTLGTVAYTTKGSAINSVSPGVFFYYTKITDGTAGAVVTITETNGSSYSAIPVQQGQAFLYEATTCTKLKLERRCDHQSGRADGYGHREPSHRRQLPHLGRLHHRGEVRRRALQKKTAPASPPVTYSFETKLGVDLVDTGASVLFDKK
jgi:hypothetical protein